MESLKMLRQAQGERLQSRLGVSLASIAEFCQRYSIQELAVFGSILRDDFKPESDIDFLISTAPGLRVTLKYQESLEQDLRRMVNRDVDLIFRNHLERSENWIRKNSILGTALIVYV